MDIIKPFLRIMVVAAIILVIMAKLGMPESIMTIVAGVTGIIIMGKILWELIKMIFGDIFHLFF